jgi:hypothetical protein
MDALIIVERATAGNGSDRLSVSSDLSWSLEIQDFRVTFRQIDVVDESMSFR